VNESTPWSPPLDLDVHALHLGIKIWDRSQPSAPLRAFWSRIGCNGHCTGQHLYDHLTTTKATTQYCLCQLWSSTSEQGVDDPSRVASWQNPHSECFK